MSQHITAVASLLFMYLRKRPFQCSVQPDLVAECELGHVEEAWRLQTAVMGRKLRGTLP